MEDDVWLPIKKESSLQPPLDYDEGQQTSSEGSADDSSENEQVPTGSSAIFVKRGQQFVELKPCQVGPEVLQRMGSTKYQT